MPINRNKGKNSAKTSKPGKKKGNTVTVDFKDTDKRTLLPEGDYQFKVADVTQEVGAESGKDYLAWVLEVIDEDPKFNGQKLYYNTSLQPKALWNLRELLETLGIETPQDEYEIDLDDCLEREGVATVEHERYDGRDRAKVTQIAALDDSNGSRPTVSDDEGEEEEEEAEEAEAEEEEETEEETDETTVTAEEVKAMDDSELNDLVKTFSLSKALAKVKPLAKKRNSILAALEEAEVLSE